VQRHQLEQGPEVRAAAAAAAAVQALPAVKQQHNLNWVTDYQLVSPVTTISYLYESA
jgi:hypothetical protein